MGTVSEGSEGGGIVGDCGFGTIVWVRRRNGSWWPGRVLGLEEIAESHAMSSRSGTPVKLLGREDASVDWYNLEKSKRVKPFRCGEFDACIERAEVSHSTPTKKREKYARREDAILHALELEKQMLEMQQESTAIAYNEGNKTLVLAERESNQHSSEFHVSSILANHGSQTSSRKISSLLDECYLDHSLPIHRNVKTSIGVDDNQEIATHISVEDASPEVKSKGKHFLSVVGNSDITDDDPRDLLPHGEHNSPFISQTVTDKNLSVFKRKTLLPGAINDSPAKRRDRRRPLVKVLQNSSKLPNSYSFPAHHDRSSNPMPAEEHLITIAHDAQKNTAIHPSPNADDSLDYSSHSWKHTLADSGNAYMLQQPGCMSNVSTPSGWTEENDFDSSATDSELEMVEEKLRSGITQSLKPLKQTAESSIESGMSHWHLKGKRNNRIISKRLHEYVDGKNLGGTDKSNVQFRETSPEGNATTSYNNGKFDCATAPSAPGPEFSSEKDMDYDTGEEDIFTGLGGTRDNLERQHSDCIDSDDDQQLISDPGWGAVRPFQLWKAYWEDPEDNLDQFYTPFSYRMIPMLIDVDLKVQARYQGEHVPLVSLMSKLNGMAIVGHPVHIEILEDGSSDLLLSSNGFGDTSAPPIWRTAKRTSMHRLPRSNPDAPNNSYFDCKLQSDLLAPQAKKKRFYHAHRSASGRFQRKPLKTVSLSFSQKTRALSSFVSEKKINGGSVFLGGLIKADGSMPLVTCIPTKVVFTRILESIGRPSAAVVHRAIAASAAERG